MASSRPSTPPLWSRVLGSRSDWHLVPPRRWRPRPDLSWVGPMAIAASIGLSWWAFAGAKGEEGSAAFGLYIGAVSIMLMAWSFLLAVRFRFLERFFGGLDAMYRTHRWAGSLAVVAMFLHTRLEPELDGGIRGASKSVANDAEGLAGVGEIMLYVLVGLSVLRWFPYRWWRWTHKILGVPFVFASWHFFTAEKPYANGSGWGWWFGAFMVAGIGAYLLRVVGRDAIAPGLEYRITKATLRGSTLELEMAPVGPALEYRAGHFAVVKVQLPGLREPHIFTIASPPTEERLRFFIRDLGDWTEKLHHAELVGHRVIVEGPYGRFEPLAKSATSIVWVAGGVGITPFLSASQALPPVAGANRPTLFYSVRTTEDAMGLEVLRRAEAEGRLNLVLCISAEGSRFSRELLVDRFGEQGLVGAHVAVCGPASLVGAAVSAARSLGAVRVETEDFDIRQGFGPDLSREIDHLFAARTES